MGKQGYGIDPATLSQIADEVIDVQGLGVEVALVIGGGNIFRGVAGASKGMDRAHADYMGMLATIINALAMQDALETRGRQDPGACRRSRCSGWPSPTSGGGPSATWRRGAWSSSPPAPATRSSPPTPPPRCGPWRSGAEIVMKATRVDGVYDKDPHKHKDARMFRRLSYLDVLNRNLEVMDSTAISLCRDNRLPILVFNMTKPGNIRRVVMGEPLGTLVLDERRDPRGQAESRRESPAIGGVDDGQ